MFADFLVTCTPYVNKVVFQYVSSTNTSNHYLIKLSSPKSIPWFVSDVTPPDFSEFLVALEKPDFFLGDNPSQRAASQLQELLGRWKAYMNDGTFTLSVPNDTPLGKPDEMYDFWTEASPYWELNSKAPTLFNSLRQSGLVVFKV